MPTIADLLDPADRERLLARLDALAELADIAKAPPVPPDPDGDDEPANTTEGSAP